MVAFIGELRGNRMLAGAGQLQAFRVTPPQVAGQGRATPAVRLTRWLGALTSFKETKT